MTSISKAPYGELIQFVQNLHTGGVTYEDMQSVNQQPNLAVDMVAALRSRMAVPQPAWYEMPANQMKRANRLWATVALAKTPAGPYWGEDVDGKWVMLLHVPRSFDELWSVVEAPADYSKYRQEGLKSDVSHLRLTSNVPDREHPVWLRFYYAAHQGIRPDYLVGRADLAASEVLSALIQFPDWAAAWNLTDTPSPWLPGFRARFGVESDWSRIPYVNRSSSRHQLTLCTQLGYTSDLEMCSPIVKEC